MSSIDGASDTVRTTINLGANSYAIAVNPVTNKVYVTHVSNNTVSVVDGDINATSTLGPGSNPFGVAVNPVTNEIYVTNSSTNGNLLVIDGGTNATGDVGQRQRSAITSSVLSHKMFAQISPRIAVKS